jgi:hypothetical protein
MNMHMHSRLGSKSVFVPEHHNMKAYKGNGGKAPHFLNFRTNNNQLHALATFPGETGYVA